MSLSTTPFHPKTGELRPAYRDAYLRGDLSAHNAALVDAYLKQHAAQGTAAFERLHELGQAGHQVRPVGWLHQQLELLRTEPARFRRRAGSLVLGAALLSGAVLAANRPAAPGKLLPATSAVASLPGAEAMAPATARATRLEAAALAPAATTATTTVSGRILNEKGQPLVGATVLDKRSGRGTSTDAQGHYQLAVPQHAQLQFGYGGYQETEAAASSQGPQTVTLLPRPHQARPRRWWLF